MITKDLANALEKIGFTYTAEEKSVNGHCYALYGGYLISVFEQNGKKVAYLNSAKTRKMQLNVTIFPKPFQTRRRNIQSPIMSLPTTD